MGDHIEQAYCYKSARCSNKVLGNIQLSVRLVQYEEAGWRIGLVFEAVHKRLGDIAQVDVERLDWISLNLDSTCLVRLTFLMKTTYLSVIANEWI